MSDTVIVVDDSLTVRMDLTETFEAAGLRAIPCATAAEARAAIAREPASVVVLDVVLPDGDGVELLQELRERSPDTGPIVLMLSSETEVKDRVRGLKTGADEYIGKPYDARYVVAKARELLRGRRRSTVTEHARVLVIDDSVTFREALREALQTADYTVSIATSGEDGLREAASQRPHAIVVDGVLPGMDGPAVIRKIRMDATLRHTACVLLTGSEGEGAELKALDAGADAFVRKEEDMDIILAKLAVAMRASSSARESVSGALGPKRVLVADDSLIYREEMADRLRAEGYDTILAHSGEDAIELLGVQSVDCILLDLQMPGLGGEATCRHIKATPIVRDIPLIVLTASTNRDVMLDCLGAGADDYISKMAELEILMARVGAHIRRKQIEDETRRFREQVLKAELEATEARAARELAETRAELVRELESKNKELEAFAYSVSHDLRAPLRSIDGFSAALLERSADALGPKARDQLFRVRAAAKRMGELIDDLLELSRVSRVDLRRTPVDVSRLAENVVNDLRRSEPERADDVQIDIEPGMTADADRRLLQVVLENLLGNAWKFTSKTSNPRIELRTKEEEEQTVFQVRDNGAGLDMAHAHKLFQPFQRLHGETEFNGTGIGLATVRRVIERHGGQVWAEGTVGEGARLSFTLPLPRTK